MTTTSASPADVSAPAPLTKVEQTMQGLITLLQSAPRDEPVKTGVMLDWVLPLFDDVRDEYHALASANDDQINAVAESLDDADSDLAAADARARQVVVALVGLSSLAFQRAGWMDKESNLLPTCPKDLAGEFTKVQMFVQAWAAELATPDEGDDTEEGAQP